MTNVYIAASFSRIKEAKESAADLEALDCNVKCVARWVKEVSPDWQPTDGKVEKSGSERIGIAMRDVADIKKAHVVVLFTEDPYKQPPRGGRHFESGYAYGLGKKLITVGGRENVFHHLPDVSNVSTWEEAKQELLRYEFSVREVYSEGLTATTFTGR